MEKIYTVPQVAEKYSIQPRTVWGWIRGKKLGAIQTGKIYRIRQQDLDEFENNRLTIRKESSKK